MSRFPQRPTLTHVANEAAVSTVTVSRVLQGSDKVAPATKKRVHEAMERIGYFGNAAATNLVSGRTTSIGVIASHADDYGYSSTLKGIEEAAREREKAVLISVIDGSDEKEVRRGVGLVVSNAVSGIIVMDFEAAGHSILPIVPNYLPVVSATGLDGKENPGRSFVSMDLHEGGKQLGTHLIKQGHQTIFILAPPYERLIQRRSLGILDVLTEARLPHYPLIQCRDWQPHAGYDGTMQLLDEYGDQVTAIACGNDEIALGAIRAVLDRGLRVPEDISVTGFDDHPLAAYSVPPLTTVRQDFVELGRLAFNLLDALIEDNSLPETRAVTPELILRSSVASPNPNRGLGALTSSSR